MEWTKPISLKKGENNILNNRISPRLHKHILAFDCNWNTILSITVDIFSRKSFTYLQGKSYDKRQDYDKNAI